MVKSLIIFRLIFAALTIFVTPLNAHASYEQKLSFKPFEECKKSPKFPPKYFLEKSYQTYHSPGKWKTFDINGDGLCDWVRGGHEGDRRDEDEPRLRDFIYLGTPNGWRHYAESNIKNMSSNSMLEKSGNKIISGRTFALEFFQPIAIYASNQTKPYIAVVTRFDAPAPPPDREKINVLQWNENFDGLVTVSENEKLLVINFLQMELCKNSPALRDENGSPFIITRGTLCNSPQ